MIKQGRKLLFLASLLAVAIFAGTLGYMAIEGWDYLDALYMTVITITTIGYTEVRELGTGGRWFTIFFALASLVLFTTAVSTMSSLVLENLMSPARRKKKMRDTIARLKGHIVLCGSGKIGRNAALALLSQKVPLVVVDQPGFIQGYLEEMSSRQDAGRSLLYVEGDPLKDHVLQSAGITAARGLICCLPEDSQNLMITLSAKKLNPGLKVSCYVMQETNIDKFYLVGADEIVSGDYVVGKKLAASLTNHNLVTFLEQSNSFAGDESAGVGDVVVAPDSWLVGRTLRGSSIYSSTGVQIFALRKEVDPRFTFNPDPDTVFDPGDVLIFFGSGADKTRVGQHVNRTHEPGREPV